MKRRKVEYGIDLGTTNSAIARLEKGEVVIKKALDDNRDIMPSCVAFRKKGLLVGDPAFRAYQSEREEALSKQRTRNSFIEFKRTMGTNESYFSENCGRGFTSEELSSEVLKKLKSFVQDDKFSSVIITVPAKFTINQKEATMRAAKLAGFEHCELLQEPIAASMAHGLKASDTEGRWLVFDFGGGTFDVALLEMEEGIIKVIDTDGDNHLGGKNLDYAIVDELILPFLSENYSLESVMEDLSRKGVFRDVLKFRAEILKNQLSFNKSYNLYVDPGDLGLDDDGEEIEVDITITGDELGVILAPIFQKAIYISNGLLKRNGITGSDLKTLILVGGPTYSPILRKMLAEQITENIDTRIDPMTAVARGAALYAATVDIPDELVEVSRDRTKIQLGIGYEPATVEDTELVTIKLLKDKMDGAVPNTIFAELVRSDKAWSSGRTQVNEMGEVFEVVLELGRANLFDVFIFDGQANPLPCEPDQFTVIQGTVPAKSTLSYNIGIGVMSPKKGYPVVKFIKGLEKSKSQPAIGQLQDLKTQIVVRPGMKEDCIKIPIYEADHDAGDTRLVDNEHVFDAIFNGEDLPGLLPVGSDVSLTFKIKDSEISVSAFFPALDHSCDLAYETHQEDRIDADWLEQEVARAEQRLTTLNNRNAQVDGEILSQIEMELEELKSLLDQGKGDYDRRKQVLDNLRRLNRLTENEEDRVEWPALEEELQTSFYRLEDVFRKTEGKLDSIDDDRVRSAIAEIRDQIPHVLKDRDVGLARNLIERIHGVNFVLADAALGVRLEINAITELDEEFDLHKWSDPNKARLLINQGLAMIATNASKKALRPLVKELVKLLPKDDTRRFEGDESLLTE